MRKFDEFFKVCKNVIFERARFNLRCQAEGESIEQFITCLYSLAESCEFAALKDELIRERIVVGIRDKALSERMQVDTHLTLDKAKREARQREAVQEQQGLLESDRGKTVDAVRQTNRSSWKPTSKANKTLPGGNSKPKSNRCQRCGKGPHSKQSCPASVCHSCKKKGHFSSMCYSKTISNVITSNNDELNDDLDISYLNNKHGIVVDGVEVPFKIDTGAEVTVVTESISNKVNKTLKPTQRWT